MPYTGIHPFLLHEYSMPRRGNILVIEDDVPISDFIADVLGDEGYTVRSACDWSSALTALAAQQADLILCDLHLPGVSHLTLIEDIRSQLGTAIPLVIMTADAQAARQLDMQGVAFCLLKPFDLEDLLGCVATHLQSHHLGSP
jgi:two-component system nitrogen regulation response regulator NtrX